MRNFNDLKSKYSYWVHTKGVMKTSVLMDVHHQLSTVNIDQENLSGVGVDHQGSTFIK